MSSHRRRLLDELVQVFESPHDGRWPSFSVWSEGVATWLPRTEKVILQSPRFGGDAAKMGPRDLDAVERLAGPLLERKDVTPIRLLTKGFPGDEVVAAIANASGRGP
jgi:hypothetical protein